MDLLCDGGSHPNPGLSQPIVHDGADFLRIPPNPKGTNHQAVYDAVDVALRHALENGVTELRISLFSPLVWTQLATNGGAVKLLGRRDVPRKLAERIPEVTWALIEAPVVVGSATASSPRALRRLAPKWVAEDGDDPNPAAA